MKLHLLLDHDGYLPKFAVIGKAGPHDNRVAREIPPGKGSIVAMDRAYNDYGPFGEWTSRGVYFVTRVKSSTSYEVRGRLKPPQKSNVPADGLIVLAGKGADKKCPHPLRVQGLVGGDRGPVPRSARAAAPCPRSASPPRIWTADVIDGRGGSWFRSTENTAGNPASRQDQRSR